MKYLADDLKLSQTLLMLSIEREILAPSDAYVFMIDIYFHPPR